MGIAAAHREQFRPQAMSSATHTKRAAATPTSNAGPRQAEGPNINQRIKNPPHVRMLRMATVGRRSPKDRCRAARRSQGTICEHTYTSTEIALEAACWLEEPGVACARNAGIVLPLKETWQQSLVGKTISTFVASDYIQDMERSHPRFQYSLWSLFVLTTFVSVLCSIGVCTDWASVVILLAGIGICFVGFGPLSLRKHPEAGYSFAVTGFLVRCLGQVVIIFGLMQFVVWILSRVP